MTKNLDRRGGAPMSGLRGISRDAKAQRDQKVMRGNAALIASLKPAMSAKALDEARVRVAQQDADTKADALADKALALTEAIPDYSARDAVRSYDVDVLPGKLPWRLGHFLLKWADHGTHWCECEMDDVHLPAVEAAIEAWDEYRVAQEEANTLRWGP
jgi:hypothetical protein